MLLAMASGAALAAVPDAPRSQDSKQDRKPDGESQKDGRRFEPFKVESVYAKDESLRQLHDNVADFIRRTSNAAEPARQGLR